MADLVEAISDLKLCLRTLDQAPIEFEEMCTKTTRPKSDRFLINLYEWPINSEESPLKKTKLLTADNSVFCKKSDYVPKRKRAMDQFIHLKSQRDIECLKIKEASKALRYLNNCSQYGFWLERLLAEKVLLKSGKSVELLTNKIREEYIEIKEKEVQIATISVSNFKFTVNSPATKRNETNFYILLLLNDLEVKASKFARAVSGEIKFDEKFTFSVHRNFRIKLQLYSIPMKEASKLSIFSKLLPCHKDHSKSSKIQYKNPNTSDFEETEVLKTSFQLVAETEITPTSLHNKAWKLDLRNSSLHDYVFLSGEAENFKICNKKSGFLTLGIKTGEYFLWNRQWCVLDGNFLNVYNSPNDEDFASPKFVLDLFKSSQIGLASEEICNRPRSFFVEISDCKFFFMADNCDEMKMWISELNLVLEFLRFKNCHNL